MPLQIHPSRVAELTGTACKVLWSMDFHAGNNDLVQRSARQLSVELNTGAAVVSRAIRELVDARLIEVHDRDISGNIYRLIRAQVNTRSLTQDVNRPPATSTLEAKPAVETPPGGASVQGPRICVPLIRGSAGAELRPLFNAHRAAPALNSAPTSREKAKNAAPALRAPAPNSTLALETAKIVPKNDPICAFVDTQNQQNHAGSRLSEKQRAYLADLERVAGDAAMRGVSFGPPEGQSITEAMDILVAAKISRPMACAIIERAPLWYIKRALRSSGYTVGQDDHGWKVTPGPNARLNGKLLGALCADYDNLLSAWMRDRETSRPRAASPVHVEPVQVQSDPLEHLSSDQVESLARRFIAREQGSPASRMASRMLSDGRRAAPSVKAAAISQLEHESTAATLCAAAV